MATCAHVEVCAIAAVAFLSSQSALAGAPAAAATKHDASDSSLPRDGQHDFDFLFGRWKVHLKRKVPGTDRWTESDGYGTYHKASVPIFALAGRWFLPVFRSGCR